MDPIVSFLFETFLEGKFFWTVHESSRKCFESLAANRWYKKVFQRFYFNNKKTKRTFSTRQWKKKKNPLAVCENMRVPCRACDVSYYCSTIEYTTKKNSILIISINTAFWCQRISANTLHSLKTVNYVWGKIGTVPAFFTYGWRISERVLSKWQW